MFQQLLENSKTKTVPGSIPRKDAERQIRELRAHLVGDIVGGLGTNDGLWMRI